MSIKFKETETGGFYWVPYFDSKGKPAVKQFAVSKAGSKEAAQKQANNFKVTR